MDCGTTLASSYVPPSSSSSSSAANSVSGLGAVGASVDASGQVVLSARQLELLCAARNVDCHNGGSCVLRASTTVCACTSGFTGSDCAESLCTRGCFNQAACVGIEQCKCPGGWTGDQCGTVDSPVAWVVAGAALLGMAAFLAAAVVVQLRRRWLPLRARGSLSLLFSLLGGMLWLYSTLPPLAERFRFGLGPEAGDLFVLWLPLVGFGLWLSANLVYLRYVAVLDEGQPLQNRTVLHRSRVQHLTTPRSHICQGYGRDPHLRPDATLGHPHDCSRGWAVGSCLHHGQLHRDSDHLPALAALRPDAALSTLAHPHRTDRRRPARWILRPR